MAFDVNVWTWPMTSVMQDGKASDDAEKMVAQARLRWAWSSLAALLIEVES
jgi:hypothetical protein